MTSATHLTILRMTFVPIFVVFMVYNDLALALAIFLLASITDLMDGIVARKFGQKTALGAFLDPVADKLLLTSSFILLSLDTLELTIRIPAWLTITVIGRDVLMVVAVLVISIVKGPRLFLPSIFGKIATVLQLLTVLVVLVANQFTIQLNYLEIMFYLTFILTLVSGVHYMAEGMKFFGHDNDYLD